MPSRPNMREAVRKCKVSLHLAGETFLRRVFARHFHLCLFCLSRKAHLAEFLLAAESIFCCQFSATSYSSSKGAKMQVGSGMKRKARHMGVGQSECYLALHVSFAHISPTPRFTTHERCVGNHRTLEMWGSVQTIQ